jgi:MYXO-CTERM domain-containing protein
MRLSHVVWAAFFAGICGALAGPARAVNIVPNFVSDANGTWSATQMTVVQDALHDWGTHVTTPQTFTVNFDFVHGGIGTYLAQWHASYSNIPNGTDIYPWTSGVSHTVDVNVDYMSGITSNQLIFTTGAVPQEDWDGYTAILHEMGHAMGFSKNFYDDNVGWLSQSDKWTSHITGTTFDPGGLNVAMNGDLQHVADANDLMGASLLNGTRKYIGSNDLAMLQLAYGYTVDSSASNSLPEPGVLGVAAVAGLAVLRRRRR